MHMKLHIVFKAPNGQLDSCLGKSKMVWVTSKVPRRCPWPLRCRDFPSRRNGRKDKLQNFPSKWTLFRHFRIVEMFFKNFISSNKFISTPFRLRSRLASSLGSSRSFAAKTWINSFAKRSTRFSLNFSKSEVFLILISLNDFRFSNKMDSFSTFRPNLTTADLHCHGGPQTFRRAVEDDSADATFLFVWGVFISSKWLLNR